MSSIKNSTPNSSGTGFFTDSGDNFYLTLPGVPMFGRGKDNDLTTSTT
jgi:hypothetical protein